MGKVSFIFALHNHQPVGNFGHIFKEAFEDCYKPFVEVLKKHPSIKAVLHYTGPLLDWIEDNEPSFLDTLRTLARDGQVEILSGGYYEPLLTLVPENDALGQLKKMNEYIEKRFSYKPKGFWLTERVWEPTFPSIARRAGLSFTTLDDSHFQYAGLGSDNICDFYITENDGDVLFIFPISMFLRYAVPFKPHNEIINYFKSFADRNAHTIVTLADDGEKFGVWPGTNKWVYKEKWLEKFFCSLEENAEWLETITFSEGLQRKRAVGKVYLPTASYEEMMEWALPAEQTNKLETLKKKLADAQLKDDARDFIRGGYFRNFFAKYPEANAMKGKQFYVSKKVHALKAGERKQQALDALWKGECNCPYWHGVFGGLYLHHLRRSTYENLIKAESIVDSVRMKKGRGGKIVKYDVNFDGVDELVFESESINAYCIPHEGGALWEIDYRPRAFNITDTMTKRKEAYHERIANAATGSQNSAAGASIHDLKKTPSPEVRQNLIYDKHIRRSLLDKCIANNISFNQFSRNEYTDFGEFYNKDYQYKIRSAGTRIELEVEGVITVKGKSSPIRICKGISFTRAAVEISYTLTNNSDNKLDFTFGSEWNFNFKNSARELTRVREATLEDEWSALGIICSSEDTFDLWQYEIKTVSQTESEYCLSSQGTSFFPHWHIQLPSKAKRRLAFQIRIVEH